MEQMLIVLTSPCVVVAPTTVDEPKRILVENGQRIPCPDTQLY